MPAPTTVYRVALDKNGDHFVNVYAQPTDPPNLLPTPVTFAALFTHKQGFTEASTVFEDMPYGLTTLTYKTSTAAAAVYFGAIGGPPSGQIAAIAVTPGQTYTAVCWLRGTWNYAGVSLTWRIYAPDWTALAASTLALTDGWQQVSVSFTVPEGVTHVALAIEKAAGTFVYFDAAGLMLVAGSTAPQAFNAGDDRDDFITGDVLALRWRLGLARPYDSTAAPVSGQMVLYSPDRRASPTSPAGEASSAGEADALPLLPGRRVRILAERGGSVYPLFHGMIAHVEVEGGSLGGRTAVVHLAGLDQALLTGRVVLPVQVSTRTDQAVALIIERARTTPIPYVLDAGDYVLGYVADTWLEGVVAIDPVRQVTDVERGRFFVDRRGRLVMYRGGRLKGQLTPAARFDERADALAYAFGADLVNQVRVPVRPRSVGAAGSDLWRLAQSQLIKPGAANSRTVLARLRSASGTPLGALTVIPPAAVTDYAANTAADGTGQNVTAFVSVTLAGDVSGSSIRLNVTSTYGANVYLLAGARLRGTPVLMGDPLVVERTDSASAGTYGLRRLDVDIPLLTSVEEADALARDLLRRRKNPFGAVRWLSLSAAHDAEQVLARTLFDRITVRDAHLRHEADYFIVAEEHQVEQGGARHTVTWLLEPANPGDAWQLGRAVLGQTTRLGLRYS